VVELVDIVLVDRVYIVVASSFGVDFAIVVVVVVVVAYDNFVVDDTLAVVVVVHYNYYMPFVVADLKPDFVCLLLEKVNLMMKV
jgi:hypothetical protein